MAIAKITDTGDEILLSCTMQSESGGVVASSIGVNGAIVGTATVSAIGMDPGTAGSTQFIDIDPNGYLRYAGQFVVTVVNPNIIAEYDDSSSISGSTGENRSANGYLLSLLNSAAASHGRQWFDTGESMRGATHLVDTEINRAFNSVGKSQVEVCIWWAGDAWGIKINGNDFFEGARTDAAAFDPHTVIVGASFNGTSDTLNGAIIKYFIVSRNSPRLQTHPRISSIGLGGDSFAVAAYAAIQAPKYDVTIQHTIESELARTGYKVPRWVQAGHSGHTVCDTGASDLSSFFTELTASDVVPEIVVYLASNNDINSANEAQRNNVTTGTVANYRTLLTNLYNTKRIRKVILTAAGSLKGNAVIDTVNNNLVLAEVVTMVEALEAWADTNLEPGFVKVINLLTLLGDGEGNRNYQGVLNAEGNVTTAPTALNDRHPSSLGHDVLGKEISRLILQAI